MGREKKNCISIHKVYYDQKRELGRKLCRDTVGRPGHDTALVCVTALTIRRWGAATRPLGRCDTALGRCDTALGNCDTALGRCDTALGRRARRACAQRCDTARASATIRPWCAAMGVPGCQLGQLGVLCTWFSF